MTLKEPALLTSSARLDGKVVALTGATGRLGAALARELASSGARLALCARRETPLRALAKELGAWSAPCDVSSARDCRAFAEGLGDKFGSVDGLVNCAALVEESPLLSLEPESLRRVLQVNVAGPLLMTRELTPLMRDGSVVNVTSGAGLSPHPGWAAYSISKTALDMLTRIMALELDGRPRVNAVDPGLVPEGKLPRVTGRLFRHLLSAGSKVNGGYFAVEETGERGEGRAAFRYL